MADTGAGEGRQHTGFRVQWDPRFTFGNLATILSVAAVLGGQWWVMDHRITGLERADETIVERVERELTADRAQIEALRTLQGTVADAMRAEQVRLLQTVTELRGDIRRLSDLLERVERGAGLGP